MQSRHISAGPPCILHIPPISAKFINSPRFSFFSFFALPTLTMMHFMLYTYRMPLDLGICIFCVELNCFTLLCISNFEFYSSAFRFSLVIYTSRLYAGPEVDVWSCGILLYALLCGCVSSLHLITYRIQCSL